MANANGCLRFDRDDTRGGFVLTSTYGAHQGELFLDFQEVFHALERGKAGYFDNVLETARAEALKFGPQEITPETAEYAAKEYAPVLTGVI